MKNLSVSLVALLTILIAGTALADDATQLAQQKLKGMGFYNGTVDGQPGSQTSAAVRRYQLAKDLKVTGELNQQTLESLGISPSKMTPSATPVPAYIALADIFRGGPYISVGPEMQVATVKQAQKNLQLLKYYYGPIDAQPNAALIAAIKAWQKDSRFRQSGRFDENTLKGLDLMPN